MRKNKLTPWQRFIKLINLERKDILQLIYYAIFSGFLSLTLPLGIQAIINLVQGAQISTSWIVMIILVTVGIIFTGVLQLMQLRIIETIQQRIFVKSAFELSYRFPKIKAESLSGYYPPELANRFFDTLTIQKGLYKILIDVPAALLQVVFSLILLSFYHPTFIAFGLVLIVMIVLVFQYTTRKGLDTSLIESKYKYKVAHWIQEIARSIISFKLSGRTNLALQKNDDLVHGYLKAREGHFRIIRFQFMKMIGFKAIITTGLLVVGSFLVFNQSINIGQFVASEIIILMVVSSVEKLILGLETMYDMLTSIEKLGQVVDMEIESQEGEKLDDDEITIEIEKVSQIAMDRDKPILDNVSMFIDNKSRILVQGESGSGKSSLLKIITGVNAPTKGHIYVNGFNIDGIHLNDYRSKLGLSLSEETPFEGTLLENLTFGDKSITKDEIIEVMQIVGLRQFVKELPKGLQTMLYPEGKQISYTITEKIVLARAILKKPKILILEDALDQFRASETQTIIDYVAHPSRPWGLIVVSNNEQWKSYCKETVYLKEGQILNKYQNA